MNIGPLQLIFTAFNGDVLASSVIDDIFAATGDSVLLLDLLAVEKDEEGHLWLSNLSDQAADDDVEYGEILGQVIDSGADEPTPLVQSALEQNLARFVVGMSPGEVNDLAYSLPAGHSALIALLEHAWAAELHQSVLDTGGVLLAQALMQPEALSGMEEALSAAITRASAAQSNATELEVDASTSDE